MVILRLFLFFPDLSLVILIKSILIKKKRVLVPAVTIQSVAPPLKKLSIIFGYT